MALIITNDFATITYTCENGPLAGLELAGGHVVNHPQAGRAVEFSTLGQSDAVRRKVKDKKIVARCEGKPQLAALADEYDAHYAERLRLVREKDIQARARDEVLLSRMREELAEIVARIPSDHVRVIQTQIGDMDGYAVYRYEADGVELNRDQLTHHGTAFAIREGALGSFASESIFSISRDNLERIQSERVTVRAEKVEARQRARREKFEQARATGQPVELSRQVEMVSEREEEETENSMNVRVVWAMPDGSEKVEEFPTH